MKYVSTRDLSAPVPSAVAIKRGLCEDGGLYMPETIPTLDKGTLSALLNKDYAERAAFVLGLFLTDYTGGAPRRYASRLCTRSFSEGRDRAS